MKLLKFLFIFLLLSIVSYSNILDYIDTNKILKEKYNITKTTENVINAEKNNLKKDTNITKGIIMVTCPYEKFLKIKQDFYDNLSEISEITKDTEESFITKKNMDIENMYMRVYNIFYHKNGILASMTYVVVSKNANKNLNLSEKEEDKLIEELKKFYK